MKTFSMQPGVERTRSVTCVLCGDSGRNHYLDCGEYSFYQCAGCGLVYQHPQPVFDDLKKRYDKEYFSYEITNEENFFKLMVLGFEDIGFHSLESAFKEKRFLDIGCATGLLLNHMRGRGWDIQGVEICRPSAEYGIRERQLPIYIGPLHEAAFPDEAFSCVHFSHLIEHLNDPAVFLSEVYRVLKPGGVTVVVTPNVRGFQARLFGSRWRSAIADHLYLFDPDTLRKMLLQTGFVIRDFKTWGGIAKGTVPGFVKKPLDYLAKRFGFGDVMLFLAEKPVE